ncbi:hypothetical protein LCGC14_2824280 [marine sediment metagenome]|uniref:DNA methylase N-4/N-6 domain-containing protein n=1 Tax=marine sediment metagenome TaxID=412755 RepID=A0A0F8YFX5_9ZZZZ
MAKLDPIIDAIGVEPYFRDDAVVIYHADCRDILPRIPKVDLVLTDPPYNSGLDYGDGTDDARPDYWEWLAVPINHCLRLADRVLIKHSSLKVAEFQSVWPSRILVWYKPFSSGFPLRGVATHWEPIHWLQGEAAAWSKDVFVSPAGNSHQEATSGHPAQMPEVLAKHWIATFASEGETILDPFMGSGTTLRAAKDLGRYAIGIEIEEKYCEIAKRRMAQTVMAL